MNMFDDRGWGFWGWLRRTLCESVQQVVAFLLQSVQVLANRTVVAQALVLFLLTCKPHTDQYAKNTHLKRDNGQIHTHHVMHTLT
jgi:hypothetical protein